MLSFKLNESAKSSGLILCLIISSLLLTDVLHYRSSVSLVSAQQQPEQIPSELGQNGQATEEPKVGSPTELIESEVPPESPGQPDPPNQNGELANNTPPQGEGAAEVPSENEEPMVSQPEPSIEGLNQDQLAPTQANPNPNGSDPTVSVNQNDGKSAIVSEVQSQIDTQTQVENTPLGSEDTQTQLENTQTQVENTQTQVENTQTQVENTQFVTTGSVEQSSTSEVNNSDTQQEGGSAQFESGQIQQPSADLQAEIDQISAQGGNMDQETQTPQPENPNDGSNVPPEPTISPLPTQSNNSEVKDFGAPAEQVTDRPPTVDTTPSPNLSPTSASIQNPDPPAIQTQGSIPNPATVPIPAPITDSSQVSTLTEPDAVVESQSESKGPQDQEPVQASIPEPVSKPLPISIPVPASTTESAPKSIEVSPQEVAKEPAPNKIPTTPSEVTPNPSVSEIVPEPTKTPKPSTNDIPKPESGSNENVKEKGGSKDQVNNTNLITPSPKETVEQVPISDEKSGKLAGMSPDNIVKVVSVAVGEAVVNKTVQPEATIIESDPVYHLDEKSCGRFGSIIPKDKLKSIVYHTIDIFLNRSQACSEREGIMLASLVNKRIKNNVMEVSSMQMDLGELIFPEGSFLEVQCRNVEGSESLKLELTLINDSEASVEFKSNWRRYETGKKNNLGPIVTESATSSRLFGTRMTNPFGRQTSNSLLINDEVKEAKEGNDTFKVEGGNFYLQLLAIKSLFDVEVTLNASTLEPKFSVTKWNFDQLYLDHDIYLSDPNDYDHSSSLANLHGNNVSQSTVRSPFAGIQKPQGSSVSRSTARASFGGIQRPTVQILHDSNRHYRRNNWMLDMYGNWLKHEYRIQLKKLLGSNGQLVHQLNKSCFSHHN